jgi:uncharacterized coiled-coil DUF342 family protein
VSDVTLELAMEASDKAMEIARLKAENDRLRDERDHWHVEQVHAYGNWEDAYKRAVELELENAKLRELLSSYWKRVHSPVASNVERDYLAEMRELGVEVDK